MNASRKKYIYIKIPFRLYVTATHTLKNEKKILSRFSCKKYVSGLMLLLHLFENLDIKDLVLSSHNVGWNVAI